ncbi:MAG: hypothetical protein IJM37_07740 [Lachnospiraceae bacterium]|nr:hypothetical protein [Lachnospiraceae bacterium]
MKERIKNVLNYRKAPFWLVCVFVLTTAALVALLVPSNSKKNMSDAPMELNQVAESTADNTTQTESIGAAADKIIIWYEDLTHDGKDERIEVDLSDIKAERDNELRTVSIYSGQSGELIWSEHADTVHAGQKGYYIYNSKTDNKAYVLEWQPEMWQERGEYRYKVISFSEDGKERVLKTDSVEFNLNAPKDKDAINVSYYLEGVNELLNDSYVLVDTNSDVYYSEQDAPVTREFDISTIISMMYEASEKEENHIIWHEDLTHDGKDERIEVDLNHLDPNQGWIPYLEPQTVMVYSGKTDKLIWTGYTDTVHVSWDGFYVYHNSSDGNAYLLEWQPYMSTGMGRYNHKVFSLSESGEEIILKSEEYTFLDKQMKEDDIDEFSVYIKKVNEYLRNSYVLIDTDNGESFYSEQDKPVTREFDADKVIEVFEIVNNITKEASEKEEAIAEINDSVIQFYNFGEKKHSSEEESTES